MAKAVGAAEIGEREAGQRVEQADRLQELEHRDEDRLAGDHHRADEGVEEPVLAAELEAGEDVAGQSSTTMTTMTTVSVVT